MAFGQHWEWRGFGDIPTALRRRVAQLPLWYQSPIPSVDVYLWCPQTRVNVKLRGEALKFKRFITREGPFECWLEDEAELIPFPLGQEAMAMLAQALSCSLPAPDHLLTRPDMLLQYLHRVAPNIRAITVRKERILHHYPTPATPPVIVELTEILSPQTISSLAIEHPRLDLVQAVRAELMQGMPELSAYSYLEAVGRWAHEQLLV